MNIKLLLTTILLIGSSIVVVAQPGKMTKESKERIEAQRIAFITQKLDLSPEEAARFWPIYNKYKSELSNMRKEYERPDMDSLSEEEASTLIEKQIEQEQLKLYIKAQMLSDLRSAVSAKKVLMLQSVENMFNKELLRKLQEKRER